MTVLHKNLTDPSLHEVKGAAAATSGQVPISDGVGSAPFGKPKQQLVIELNTANNDDYSVPLASSIDVVSFDLVIDDATATSGSAVITIVNQSAASLGADITVTDSQSAGTVFSTTASSNNTGVTKLQITTPASGNNVRAHLTITYRNTV